MTNIVAIKRCFIPIAEIVPRFYSRFIANPFHLFLQGYYREGVALQCLGRHAEALAAFSSGLAQDPKSLQLLAGLVEAAMKSPLKGNRL